MLKRLLMAGAAILLCSTGAWAGGGGGTLKQCSGLPNNNALQTALTTAVGKAHAVSKAADIGFLLNMWATVVANDGTVCAVAYSGGSAIQGQWLASRVISAQKANTANALSLSVKNGPAPLNPLGFAIATANLYSAVQPGGSLFGLQASNPVAAVLAYGDTALGSDGKARPTGADSDDYGTANDPMVGQVIGGINVFGGGLALYNSKFVRIGGVGVSGDTSCMDHIVAWYLRNTLGFDYLSQIPGFNSFYAPTPDKTRPDNIIFDIAANPNGGTGISASGYGHPVCAGALTGFKPGGDPPLGNGDAQAIVSKLPAVQ